MNIKCITRNCGAQGSKRNKAMNAHANSMKHISKTIEEHECY